MKKIIFALALAALSMNVSAEEKFTCDDLDGLSATITEVSTALQQVGSIQEGDEVDSALRELIDGLKLVAQVENESDLNDFVAQTEAGWTNMDGTQLAGGLSGTQGSLDRLIARDCN